MRTVILGFDAFDPTIVERLYEQGRLRYLEKYIRNGGYSRFAVSDPPQSEVSWTSIATGLNPGGHGLFDFVHRNPATYALSVSLLPTQQSFLGTRFVPPHQAPTFFDQAVADGYPATALWWPATFPARLQSPVRTIPGLGTPDLLGRLGVGSLFTTAVAQPDKQRKVPLYPLQKSGKDRYRGALRGPLRGRRGKRESTTVDFELEVRKGDLIRLSIGNKVVDLREGVWSPVLECTFHLGPLLRVRALTQVVVTGTAPEVTLYALPLQIHPLHSPWHFGTPHKFIRETWQACGPFLTLGWPQDTTALEEGYINDEQFLALCEAIVAMRHRTFLYHLSHFQEGILAGVFDTLDRVQHMFLQQHPEIVERWYERFDRFVGKVEQQLAVNQLLDTTQLVILSDHGFAPFNYKVHVNRWLEEQGYLQAHHTRTAGTFQDVNWRATKAYAIGLNSIYLNLAGREREGVVVLNEQGTIVRTLCERLTQWQGPDGTPVVMRALPRAEVFDGPLTEHGPDIFVGFAEGYRASQQTGLGGWEPFAIEPNGDHWAADHCLNEAVVPGVIFASHEALANFSRPSYHNVPALVLGKAINNDAGPASPLPVSGEDAQLVEERLKGLGYL